MQAGPLLLAGLPLGLGLVMRFVPCRFGRLSDRLGLRQVGRSQSDRRMVPQPGVVAVHTAGTGAPGDRMRRVVALSDREEGVEREDREQDRPPRLGRDQDRERIGDTPAVSPVVADVASAPILNA